MEQYKPGWTEILICPVSGQSLSLLNESEIKELNQEIEQGGVLQLDGSIFHSRLEAALQTPDNQFLYPILDGILILLKELGLSRSASNIPAPEADPDKQLVQNFYNEKGWFVDDAGNYEDAVIYEDLREVSAEYLKRCHARVSRYLNPAGTYILDAASGAIQYNEYLQYSEAYDHRVCVDFSIQALKEAKRKLGNKGIYVLADICKLPFRDGVMDGFISLNTIYHIPRDQQADAIHELYRVLSPGKKGVVVYDWFKHSTWMNIGLLPFRGFVYLKNRIFDSLGKLQGKKGPKRRLYFYAHDLAYMRNNLPPFRLAVWRSISVPFMRYYIHSWMFGKQILDRIYSLEESFPERCGKNGEYPLFIFEKPQEGN